MQTELIENESGIQHASPQEQQLLEQVWLVAQEFIHSDDQTGDQIAQMVLSDPNVAKGIGEAAATVLMAVEKRVGQIEDSVKLALAEEIVNELMTLAVEAGALGEDEAEQGALLDEVVSRATSRYLELQESMGELNHEQLESSVNEAKQSLEGQPQLASGGLMQSGGSL